jgi:hypothetical protein
MAVTEVTLYLVALMLGAVGLEAVSLWQDRWYHINTQTTNIIHGLFKSCTNANCGDNSYNGFTSTVCSRSGTDEKQRTIAVMAVTFVAGGCGIIAAFFLLASLKFVPRIMIILSLIFTALAFCAAGVSLALFTYNLESWFYCSVSYCSLLAKSSTELCVNIYGYSFILCAVGCGMFLFIGTALVGLMVYTQSTQQFVAAKSRGLRPSERRAKASEPIVDADSSRNIGFDGASYRGSPSPSVLSRGHPDGISHLGAPLTRPPPIHAEDAVQNLNPGADWEQDAHGLFWSPSQALFLDVFSMQYYDPAAEMWFDPKKDLWYSL